ncbi:MAG: hypothetical protein K2K89_01060 [Ruminococcus sp.]|nr:hypothetical protein [Ruminococcus sp.]
MNLKKIFCNQPNLYIVNGSAENVNTYLAQHGVENADYIVSGLPFTSLPADNRLSERNQKSTAGIRLCNVQQRK